MRLTLSFQQIPDPDGHRPSLRLKGDWLIASISDGTHSGYGEASHSGDNKQCTERMKQLFNAHLRSFTPSAKRIRHLEKTAFKHARDFISATAISALNQALYDLLAKQMGIPLWKLFVQEPVRKAVPLYATLNRALQTRSKSEYSALCQNVWNSGFKHIKCAPFESVLPSMPAEIQITASQSGLSILRLIRKKFPGLNVRVDFHNRFHINAFTHILPQLEALRIEWIEEPCQNVNDFSTIRRITNIPLAAGELFFGSKAFVQLMERQLVDIIMPDVKHVGGFGPLLQVCSEAERRGVAVSPHNPSGPVAGFASLHASAVSPSITSIETALLSTGKFSLPEELIREGMGVVPSLG